MASRRAMRLGVNTVDQLDEITLLDPGSIGWPTFDHIKDARPLFLIVHPQRDVNANISISLKLLHDGALFRRHDRCAAGNAGERAFNHGLFERIHGNRLRRRLRPNLGEKCRELPGSGQCRHATAQPNGRRLSRHPIERLHSIQKHLLACRWVDVMRQDRVGNLLDSPGEARRYPGRTGGRRRWRFSAKAPCENGSAASNA